MGSQGILLWGMCVEKVAFFSTQKNAYQKVLPFQYAYATNDIISYNEAL